MAYPVVVEAWPIASIDPGAKAAAALSKTDGAVNARNADGDVRGVPGAATLAPGAGMRETRVTTCPGAMSGNSASGPAAACGVNTPMEITRFANEYPLPPLRTVHAAPGAPY